MGTRRPQMSESQEAGPGQRAVVAATKCIRQHLHPERSILGKHQW